MTFGFELIIIFLMIAMNAIFAAYEMALASISRAKLTALVQNKRKGAEEAAFMKDRMEASLAVVQVGITFVGAIAAATGGAGVAESVAPFLQNNFGLSKALAEVASLVLLIIPLSCLTIIFAELVPKMYALNNRVWVCLTLSPIMKALSIFAYPVITVFELIVKKLLQLASPKGSKLGRFEDQVGLHELNAAVSMARTSHLIGARQEKIVLSAAQLSVRPIKEIIIPISEISLIPIESTLNDALLRAHLDMHTRFPVYANNNDPQSIQGYINVKDIMVALKLNPLDPTVKGILRPIRTFPDDMAIATVLEAMIQEKLHIAMVAGKDQKIAGMVTMEDIIEEMVGEIEDEFDRLPNQIHPYAGGWIIGGGVPMTIVLQTVGLQWPPNVLMDPNIKLAEWCHKKLGLHLKGGETIETNGLQIMVRKLRRKKVGEAVVNLVNKPA